MRGTLHLLGAIDLPMYVAAMKTHLEHAREEKLLNLYGVTHDEQVRITSVIRSALDGRRLTREELANEVGKRVRLRPKVQAHLLSGWGRLLQPAAFDGSLCFGPSQGRNVTFVRPDQWLEKWHEPSIDEAFKELLRRFFAAFGPATHQSVAHWWGTRPDRARDLMSSVADELQEVEFEGRQAWIRQVDIDEIKVAHTIHSVRLLPSWDCYVMFYHPREFPVPHKFRLRIFRQLQGNAPVLLVDGLAAGVWERRQRGRQLEVRVDPFTTLNTAQKRVEEETTGLGEFLGTPAKVSFAK